MAYEKCGFALATVMVLIGFTMVNVATSVHAITYYTLVLGVSGQGTLTWIGMYQNSIYTSGTTVSNTIITVPAGIDLTFTATPKSDASFNYWMLDESSKMSTNPYVIPALGFGSPAYHSVTANFVQFAPDLPLQNPQYDVCNVAVDGLGRVYWSSSINGAPFESGWVDGNSSIAITKGATVTLTAVTLNGDHFVSWVINGVNVGSDNPYGLFGKGGKYVTVVAYFDQWFYANPPLQVSQYDTIQVRVQGPGILYWSSSYGAVYDSGATVSSSSIVVPHGGTVTFTAVPMSGSQFGNWMVDSANLGSNNPYVLYGTYATLPTTVTAVFNRR